MTRLLIEAGLIGAAFVAGKFYGARAEADAIAAGLRLESYAMTELGNAYRAVVRNIRAKEQTLLARVKKFL